MPLSPLRKCPHSLFPTAGAALGKALLRACWLGGAGMGADFRAALLWVRAPWEPWVHTHAASTAQAARDC